MLETIGSIIVAILLIITIWLLIRINIMANSMHEHNKRMNIPTRKPDNYDLTHFGISHGEDSWLASLIFPPKEGKEDEEE